MRGDFWYRNDSRSTLAPGGAGPGFKGGHSQVSGPFPFVLFPAILAAASAVFMPPAAGLPGTLLGCVCHMDSLNTILNILDGFFVGAVRAAEEFIFCIDAVPDDLAAAVGALGRQGMDGALEAVENMRLAAGQADFKAFVIIVPADFTRGHVRLLFR
jgi:hypothetical protein